MTLQWCLIRICIIGMLAHWFLFYIYLRNDLLRLAYLILHRYS